MMINWKMHHAYYEKGKKRMKKKVRKEYFRRTKKFLKPNTAAEI